MELLQNILLGVGIFVAVMFSLLVFFTGKGDAMSGGSGVRTTFKGKAGFDEHISRLTLITGIVFMVLMLILNVIGAQIPINPNLGAGSGTSVPLPK